MNASERAGAALAAIATAMVGSVVAASSLLVDYPALAGQAGRYALGAAVLAVVVRANGLRRLPRLSARELGLVAALAASGLVGFNLCVLAAVDRADPAVVGLVVITIGFVAWHSGVARLGVERAGLFRRPDPGGGPGQRGRRRGRRDQRDQAGRVAGGRGRDRARARRPRPAAAR